MDSATLIRAKDLAARHLARRMRSEREIEDYLGRKGFCQKVTAKVVSDFRRVGLLDDRALAREWVLGRLARRPAGRRLIEQRLMARGISETTVAEVLEEIFQGQPEAELARKAAESRLEQLARYRPEIRRQRLYRFLTGRGFSGEAVSQVLEEIEA